MEIVRAWMRACNGTDMERALALCDPAFEMTEPPVLPGAAVTTGLEAVRRYFAGWRRNWSEWDWQALDVRDLPPDKVLVNALLRLRGLRSGVWVEHRWVYLFTLRDGKLVRQNGFEDEEAALAAAEPENAELVRRMADVWNERGWRGVVEEGILHPEVEYHDDPAWPEARSASGPAELVERFDEVLEAIGQGSHTTVEQIVAEGANVALVCRMTAEGSASRIPYEYRWGFLCRIKDGQVDYIRAYLDADEAVSALRWSE